MALAATLDRNFVEEIGLRLLAPEAKVRAVSDYTGPYLRYPELRITSLFRYLNLLPESTRRSCEHIALPQKYVQPWAIMTSYVEGSFTRTLVMTVVRYNH